MRSSNSEFMKSGAGTVAEGWDVQRHPMEMMKSRLAH